MVTLWFKSIKVFGRNGGKCLKGVLIVYLEFYLCSDFQSTRRLCLSSVVCVYYYVNYVLGPFTLDKYCK